MLYAHVIEMKVGGTTKYVLVLRDFYEFSDPEEKITLTPDIRATFKEPSGIRGLLNTQIDAWAKHHNVSLEGIQPISKHFEPDTEFYIAQLKARIEQMAILLQGWKDVADEEEQKSEQSEVTICNAHERLRELETIIRCAQQNGCKHIEQAIAEIRSGGTHGH